MILTPRVWAFVISEEKEKVNKGEGERESNFRLSVVLLPKTCMRPIPLEVWKGILCFNRRGGMKETLLENIHPWNLRQNVD